MKTLFLAGDSTVQSYSPEQYPQMGWGQVLHRFFEYEGKLKEYTRSDAPGKHCVAYEMRDFRIENHALAARSSRSFIEQGRLDEIMRVAKPGDFMAIQFAHNDAYEARAERFVPVDQFGDWLKKYADACTERRMQCIFVTPVTMRVFDDNGHCRMAFKEYRDVMVSLAHRMTIPCLDLSLMSTELIERMGAAEARNLFLWLAPGEYPEGSFADGINDNAHFQEYGAMVVASLVAQAIRESNDDRLRYIIDRIKTDLTIEKPKRNLPENFMWAAEGSMQDDAIKNILARN